MKNKRRDFLKLSGTPGLAIASNRILDGFAHARELHKDNLQSLIPGSSFYQKLSINEQINLDIERVKSILETSQEQLIQGLILHWNSLVMDAYGFMPRAAHDGTLNSSITSEHLKWKQLLKCLSSFRYSCRGLIIL